MNLWVTFVLLDRTPGAGSAIWNRTFGIFDQFMLQDLACKSKNYIVIELI